MKLAAILAAVRAALTVAKGAFHKLGWSKGEAAANVALTVDEAASMVAVHGATGSAVVFLQAVEMAGPTFAQYLRALHVALDKHRATGAVVPTVIALPPGISVDVVTEKAAQMEAAANAILTGGVK